MAVAEFFSGTLGTFAAARAHIQHLRHAKEKKVPLRVRKKNE